MNKSVVNIMLEKIKPEILIYEMKLCELTGDIIELNIRFKDDTIIESHLDIINKFLQDIIDVDDFVQICLYNADMEYSEIDEEDTSQLDQLVSDISNYLYKNDYQRERSNLINYIREKVKDDLDTFIDSYLKANSQNKWF